MSVVRIPLGRLLAIGRTADHPVARSPGREKLRTFGELERTAASLVNRIRDEPRGRWLVHADGAFELAAALLSLWEVGSSALLAPNAQPGTIERLAGESVGVISDSISLTGVKVLPPREGEEASSEAVAWRTLDSSTPALELLTSGTTDGRKRVPKTLHQLDAEAAAQEARFGRQLAAAEIVSTVSHQHLYGLLFQVLWPLSAGRVFRDRAVLHSGEFAPSMAAAPAGAVLVSAPVQLKRLADRDDLAELAPLAHEVFSSGGPLDAATADILADAFGRAPIEVYGSTETGGIASRQQSEGSEVDRLAWTALDGVALQRNEASGVLRVRSAFASAKSQDANDWVETSDRVEMLSEGRFMLRGRADRVVKVGEKPASLPDLEADLDRHPAVEEAACLLIDRTGGNRLGAVVVLSSEGRALLSDAGRRAVGSDLASHLTRSWDRVFVPRAWRYVDRLPRDPLGKIAVEALREILAEQPRKQRPTRPIRVDERTGEGFYERTVLVPDDLAHLEGHFPGHPVVPGIAQLEWAFEFARDSLGLNQAATRVEALKFNHVIRPGDEVTIRLEPRPDGRGFAFRISAGEQALSSGRILVASDRG